MSIEPKYLNQNPPSRNRLGTAAVVVTVMGVMVAAWGFWLEFSLPYRIGPGQYQTYKWAGYVVIATWLMLLLAIVLGAMTNQEWPWAEMHREELMEDWRLLQQGRRPRPIAPLQ